MSFVGDTCTPIYGLPYATGASAPCNIDDTMCAFNDAVQEEIDRLAGVSNRTAVTVPMAKVAITVPTPFTSASTSATQILSFDSALVDTDNMFSAADPDRVTVNTPGVYAAQAFLYVTSVGAALQSSSVMRVDISGFLGAFIFDTLVYASGTPVFQAASGIWTVPTAGTAITMGYAPFIQGSDVMTIQQAQLGLFWLCDLP